MRDVTSTASPSRSFFRAPGLRPLVALFAWMILGLALSGCAIEPITGKWQFQAMPESELNVMGLEGYQQILQDAKISNNAEYNDLVTKVGRRIAAVADVRMAQEGREPFQWEFTVVDDPKQVNAFALPGGKVAFYTGILPICETELGVAVVMGHEVAHAYAQHGGARVSRQFATQGALQVAMVALSGAEASMISQLALAALGAGAQFAELPFSRGDESSADQIGLILMAEAGYDPREAVRFWERMGKASGGEAPPEFLSTHPSHETRAANLQGWMPGAMEVYQQSRNP